ncbi:transporter substrate-binding domain-containing protein [Mangrovibrevibacter kandeliae]|uniref:transporter substrate-binding domain-containing protein n=1 Tax=Mangrovibrevibacter kandeliae TaxID=2968473 RepID=UPI0021173819|nr:transporter substrate-binding domain-containing protein [Aurantimonas sp. CSK15Z-1]
MPWLRRLLFAIGCLVCGVAAAQSIATPNFADQHQRLTKPDLASRERIRFLTSTDFPPFSFLDVRGRLGGFNVDLVRAICDELGLSDRCQIEAMPFDQLVPALLSGQGDAIIAGIAMTPVNHAQLAFTEPYFRYPARFVTRRDHGLAEPLAVSLRGRKVAVVDGSAHAAMLASFFPDAVAVAFPDRARALEAMTAGAADAFFGDGVGLSFWLASSAAGDCCAFAGGPFLSDRYLGEGQAIAVAPDDRDLVQAFDYAIVQAVEHKRMSELLLRYFPISAF